MRYFSEETVMDILDKIERENGHSVALSFPNFSELKSINIPDRHGRLKDTDALIEKTRMWSLVRGDEYFELRVKNTIVKELLEAVPTIVEATE